MLPIIDQGVHTHACHHALTWPMACMGLGESGHLAMQGNHLA